MDEKVLTGDRNNRKVLTGRAGRIFTAFLFAVFLISQIIVLALNVEIFPSLSTHSTAGAIQNEYCGNILVTGDTLGRIDLAGCERFGSISRRVAFLNKFKHGLYLDYGNFSSDKLQTNHALLPVLFQDYEPLRLNAVNLTKRDLINLHESNFSQLSPTLVSANLNIESSVIPAKMVRQYKLIPFVLRNRSQSKTITIGVTGVTNTLRKLHGKHLKFSVADVEQSLKAVQPRLEDADLKILLFNDSFFKLKNLIIARKINFDLVIANTTVPGQVDKMVDIAGTPVVFVEDQGRSIGHVIVTKKKNRFSFEFEAYRLGMGAPQDAKAKKLADEITERIKQSESDHNHSQEQGENHEI